LLKNTSPIKKYAIGRYGQYQKIISTNSALSFQRKPFGDALEDFTMMKSIKNQRKSIHLRYYYRIVPAFEYCLIIDDISSRQRPKKIERLKDTFVIVAGAREIKR
jgi:hypothetical protein